MRQRLDSPLSCALLWRRFFAQTLTLCEEVGERSEDVAFFLLSLEFATRSSPGGGGGGKAAGNYGGGGGGALVVTESVGSRGGCRPHERGFDLFVRVSAVRVHRAGTPS